jgi:tRNA G18 (ribose-2'-O)-methylase SpoU
MDETMVIPQAASVESLNAGVAASIVLYEAASKSEVRSQIAEVKKRQKSEIN